MAGAGVERVCKPRDCRKPALPLKNVNDKGGRR